MSMRRSGGLGEWTAFVLAAVAIAAGSIIVTGQITVPNTFVNRTVADAPQVNANFAALAAAALNRTGGTMTGTLNAQHVIPTADVTYDVGDATHAFRKFYVTGTSGGVPFFSATNTLGTSAALGATQLMLGGGAGAAPSTDANWTVNSAHVLNSATQPRCVAYSTAVQSIANGGGLAAVALNAEDLDVGALHDNATNNTRITIAAGGDGFYLVTGAGSWAGNVTSFRLAALRKNGATTLQTVYHNPNTSDGSLVSSPPVVWFGVLAAGDYVEFMVGQNSGGALNFGSATRDQGAVLSVAKLW